MIYYLTKREYQVLEILSEGNNNKQIASRLKISARTVESFLNTLYHKVGCKTRLELAVKYNSMPENFMLAERKTKLNQIIQLHKKGNLDIYQIAERLNSTYHYVWKIIDNYKQTMFKQEGYTLSLEQQFELTKIEKLANIASQPQLVEAYLKACKLIMIKDNLLKKILKTNE